MKRTVLAAAMLLIAGSAFAAPQSIGDCEKIADPDAYNRCLAGFGPAMKSKAGTMTTAAPAAVERAPVVQSGKRYGRGRYATRRRSGGSQSYARSGRVRMTIDVGRSSSRGKTTRSRGRRR